MDLEEWLSSIGLSEYADCFEANHVDFEMAKSLSDSDLREIGITSFGHRKILLERLAKERALDMAQAQREHQQTLKGGLWFHEGGSFYYIPDGDKDNPMIYLSKFAKTVAVYQHRLATWLLHHYPEGLIRTDPAWRTRMMKYWKDFSEIMITEGGWNLAWRGGIYTSTPSASAVGTALRKCFQGYTDLKWDDQAVVSIIDIHDPDQQIDVTWAELLNARPEVTSGSPDDLELEDTDNEPPNGESLT